MGLVYTLYISHVCNSIPEDHFPAAKPRSIMDLKMVEETASWVYSGNLKLSYRIIIVVVCGLFYSLKVAANFLNYGCRYCCS